MLKGLDESKDVTLCFGENATDAEKAGAAIRKMMLQQCAPESEPFTISSANQSYNVENLYSIYSAFKAFFKKNEVDMNMDKNWMPLLHQLKTLELASGWVIGKEPETKDYHAYPAKYYYNFEGVNPEDVPFRSLPAKPDKKKKLKLFDTPLFSPIMNYVMLEFDATAIWEAYLLYRVKLFSRESEDCDFLFPGFNYNEGGATPTICLNDNFTFTVRHLLRTENNKVLTILTKGKYDPRTHTLEFEDMTNLNDFCAE